MNLGVEEFVGEGVEFGLVVGVGEVEVVVDLVVVGFEYGVGGEF